MNKAERVAGFALTALGAAVMFYSFTELTVGTLNEPGSGFFTFICGSGIFILSVLWLFLGFKAKIRDEQVWEPGQWVIPLIAVGVTLVYGLLIQALGYIIATVIFCVLWQVVISRSKVSTIIMFTILGTAGMLLVFRAGLKVPLPAGPLGF
jgi:hypothetical protein